MAKKKQDKDKDNDKNSAKNKEAKAVKSKQRRLIFGGFLVLFALFFDFCFYFFLLFLASRPKFVGRPYQSRRNCR